MLNFTMSKQLEDAIFEVACQYEGFDVWKHRIKKGYEQQAKQAGTLKGGLEKALSDYLTKQNDFDIVNGRFRELVLSIGVESIEQDEESKMEFLAYMKETREEDPIEQNDDNKKAFDRDNLKEKLLCVLGSFFRNQLVIIALSCITAFFLSGAITFMIVFPMIDDVAVKEVKKENLKHEEKQEKQEILENTEVPKGKLTAKMSGTHAIIQVSSIVLDKSELVLEKGNVGTLTAMIIPENATNKSIIWTSENWNITGVDSNGGVSAVNVGETRIIASAEAGGITTSIPVKVIESKKENENGSNGKLTKTKSITVNAPKTNIRDGESVKLRVSTNPKIKLNASDIKWSSSYPNIASVNKNGVVTGKLVGYTRITARVGDKTSFVVIWVN